MEPDAGFYENVPVLDFNALYPNIMMSYFLDPALIVLDKRFANCLGVRYLDVRFNEKIVFRYAQDIQGVMNQHTWNLVFNRKIAQGVMNFYVDCMEYVRLSALDAMRIVQDPNATEDDKKKLEFSKIVSKIEGIIHDSEHVPTKTTDREIKNLEGFVHKEIKTISKTLTYEKPPKSGKFLFKSTSADIKGLKEEYDEFVKRR